jgi:hypothetical protein
MVHSGALTFKPILRGAPNVETVIAYWRRRKSNWCGARIICATI